MNTLFRVMCALVSLSASLTNRINAQEKKDIKEIFETKLSPKFAQKLQNPEKTSLRKKIRFWYQDKSLVDVINEIAAEKKVNIIIPAEITGKLTFYMPKKISVEQAWNLLHTILDTAGLSLRLKSDAYTIEKKDQATLQTKILPLYINTDPQNLPDMDEAIRYIYYFTNISIAGENNKQKKDLILILKDIIPNADKNVVFDDSINGMIIASNASAIKKSMIIINALDETGFSETIKVITLNYIAADFVESLFRTGSEDPSGKIQEGLIPTDDSASARYPWLGPSTKQKPRARYFNKTTRVKALTRTNSLVLMGKVSSVDRVIDFITKYIDQPLATGHSIVHIEELNNLDAKEMAETLGALLQLKAAGESSDESTRNAAGKSKEQAKTYNFDQVIITSEDPTRNKSGDDDKKNGKKTCEFNIPGMSDEDAKSLLPQEVAPLSSPPLGGNKIIVVARKREWEVIRPLIKSLDTAQPQIALEALIVDLTMTDARALGAQMRNKLNAQLLMNEVNAQMSHLANPWLNFDQNNLVNSPPGLAANLLTTEAAGNIYQSNLPDGVSADQKINITETAGFTPGSTVITLSEKQAGKEVVWSILQMLDNYSNVHIISRPFVVTANNKCAILSSAETRLVKGNVQTDSGGGARVDNKNISAGITIQIVPRINDRHEINLTIAIDINQFISNATSKNNTRQVRHISTNANVLDGQILILGGLDKLNEIESKLETPLLGRLPLFGWLFKKRSRTREKQTLMIFIVPRILMPRLSGIDPYAWHKLNFAKSEADMEIQRINTSLDPITKSFFKPISPTTYHEVVRFQCSKQWKKEGYDWEKNNAVQAEKEKKREDALAKKDSISLEALSIDDASLSQPVNQNSNADKLQHLATYAAKKQPEN